MENNQKVAITIGDLGNYNGKFWGKDAECVFSSKYSTDYQACPDSFQRIEIDGKTTYMEVGTLSREFSKVNRDYLAQLMYGIVKVNKEDVIDTNLTLLLPILQMENKPKLIENLRNKDFSIKYNGVDKLISIKDVMVLPEGYVSYFSLTDLEKQNDICIVDIGSRTINLCVLENGKIQKLNTIKQGTFDFFSKIRSIESAKGEDFVEEDVERLIKNGSIKVFQKLYVEFLNDILNNIKPYLSLKTYQVYWTGGGALMLEEYINKLPLTRFKILEKALTSNLIGAKAASELVWKVNTENVQ